MLGRPVTGKEPRSKGIKSPCQERRIITAPARRLGCWDWRSLQFWACLLEGQQDKQARWWIPATAVDEAVRRSRGIETSVHPSMEETIPIPLERHEPQASEDAVVSEDTTTSSAVPEDGEGRYTDTADTVLHLTSELGELRAKLEATAKT